MQTIRILSCCLMLAGSMASFACQAEAQAAAPEYCQSEGRSYSQGAVITYAGQVFRCAAVRVGEPASAPTLAWVALNKDHRTLAVPVASTAK